jgi:hypothetical protein
MKKAPAISHKGFAVMANFIMAKWSGRMPTGSQQNDFGRSAQNGLAQNFVAIRIEPGGHAGKLFGIKNGGFRIGHTAQVIPVSDHMHLVILSMALH